MSPEPATAFNAWGVSGVTFGTVRWAPIALMSPSPLLNNGREGEVTGSDSPLDVAGVKRGVDGEPGRGKFKLGGRMPRANGLTFNWLSSLDAVTIYPINHGP